MQPTELTAGEAARRRLAVMQMRKRSVSVINALSAMCIMRTYLILTNVDHGGICGIGIAGKHHFHEGGQRADRIYPFSPRIEA